MKKLLYLLLVVPFAMMISSCSSDKDLPNVDIKMTFDNAAVSDKGTVYVIQDSVFQITDISVTAVDSKKEAAIVNMRYFWNNIPAPGLTWSPLPINIDMAQMPQPKDGENVLTMRATLLETDKSIAYTVINVPIVAVESETDLPAGLTLGAAELTFGNRPQSDKE